jgi:hypothetical protein
MRSQDWNMAMALKKQWEGGDTPGVKLCPLLENLDGLLKYLDDIGLKPGINIPKCPDCGQEHRWSFIRTMMQNALDIKPARKSALLEAVDRKLDGVRAMYGGDKGYREMIKASDEFFARVKADNVYRP